MMLLANQKRLGLRLENFVNLILNDSETQEEFYLALLVASCVVEGLGLVGTGSGVSYKTYVYVVLVLSLFEKFECII